MSRLFIPRTECTVLSGDCFRHGRCLQDCRERHRHKLSLEQQVRELRAEVAALKKLVRRRAP